MAKGVKLLVGIFFLLFTCNLSVNAVSKTELDNLLDELDKVVGQRQAILDQEEAALNKMKKDASGPKSDLARVKDYWHFSQEYLHFDGDTAVAYATKALTISKKINDKDAILKSQLCLLRALTRKGLYSNAADLIQRIGDIKNIPANLRGPYATMQLDFHMRVCHLANSKELELAINGPQAWKLYSPYLEKNSAAYFFYKMRCTDEDVSINEAEKVLQNLKNPSYEYADLAYALAKNYQSKGLTEQYYIHLVGSAINDIELGNTEVSSIMVLLQTPLLDKDLKRSIKYTNILVDNVQRYHDLNRALTVVGIQHKITERFNSVKNKLIVIAVVASIFFLAAFILSLVQTRMLLKERKKNRSKDTQSGSTSK